MARLRPLRRLLLPAALTLVSTAFVWACLGDDPATVSSQPDAGDDARPGVDARAEDSTSNADSGGLDASNDAAPSDDAEAPYDAGPPVWDASVPDAAVTVLGSATTPKCKMELGALQTAVAPPQWTLYVRKLDANAGTCAQPKGVRALGTTYATPTGDLIRQPGEERFVIAYNQKASPSGASPNGLYMKQLDWYSGNDLHLALMKTKAVPGVPATVTLGFTQLFFGDGVEAAAGTVRLKGTGSFPGETGTGSFFFAVYSGFITGVAQPASAADSCVRMD